MVAMKVAAAHAAVSDAARPFESRWTLSSLGAVDEELYLRLREQQNLWNAALITGDDAEIREQTGCMCRGWAAAFAAMEGRPDNACFLGFDPASGTRVAIGDQTAAQDRVRDGVIWLTPNECAVLLARTQALAEIKGLFPGAEIIELYPREGNAA
jgi:hypothetical protein